MSKLVTVERSAVELAIEQLTHRIDHTPGLSRSDCPRCIALNALRQAMAAGTVEAVDRLREAVARHARTLDDRALGHPAHVARDRDAIDNELYNAVRAVDPAWWDAAVPGLAVDRDAVEPDA